MLGYLYKYMAYVISDMIHTSGDGALDMRTRSGPADWAPALKIAGGKRASIHRNSQWDFPRKRALFTSDGPDSATSESDTPEGHADRPPDVEYSKRWTTEKRQDEGGTE